MTYIIIIVVLFITYYLIGLNSENEQHWSHAFDNLKFSSQEFYKATREAIEKREVHDIEFSIVFHGEGGVFGAQREYLRVQRDNLIFDICAAPFGTCFFVSSWFVERPGVIKLLLRKIEKLAPFVDAKTYYKIDTEGMFKGIVQTGLLEAIDAMTNKHGVRALSELERRFPETKIGK